MIDRQIATTTGIRKREKERKKENTRIEKRKEKIKRKRLKGRDVSVQKKCSDIIAGLNATSLCQIEL